MRRADRLFRLIQLVRRRRVTTASRLAAELELSPRTVYRDIQDLILAGVPIKSQAGVGYALSAGFDLPPLMFTPEEVEALVLGTRMVAGVTDASLAKAAITALEKIDAVLPDSLRRPRERASLLAPKRQWPAAVLPNFALARAAIDASRKMHFKYTKPDAAPTERVVHPIGLFFWGSMWTLAAYCELRQGYRNFRLDRLEGAAVLEDTFDPATGKTLEDFLRYVAATVNRPVEEIEEKVMA